MSFEPSTVRKAGFVRRHSVLLRRRLKSRPDTEHEMMLNRLGFVAVALGYLWIASFYGSVEAAEAFQYGIALCTMYAVCSSVLLAHIVWRPGISHTRRCIALIMDMTVLSVGMYLGDSAFALGYPIYLWIIFGNGFRFGVKYLAASAAAAVAGFAAVIATTPIWIRDIDLSIGLMIGLVVLPAYVAALIRKLSEAKRQAEEASKAKSMFLASVSHELRTPLNAIITLSDLLAPLQSKREPREMTQTIASSGRSLLKMINNILDLSRIEAGRNTRVLEDFEVHGVLAQVRRVLNVQANTKGLTLSVWIGSDVPAVAHGAAQDFEEILVNLVGNAIKFTSHGGIWVSVEANGDLIEVAVRDTGIGIAEEAQRRIFESFVQADASIIDRFGGTGLGLSIVKQLVERNGGLISVRSELGEGSTFLFSLALAPVVSPPSIEHAEWAAIVVSRNLALEAQLRFHRVAVNRIALLDVLPTALKSWASGDLKPVVIIDTDTMSPRELVVVDRWKASVLSDTIVGVLSAGNQRHEALAMLPFAVALSYPLSASALAAFGALSKPFVATPDEDGLQDVCARTLSILAAEDNVTNQKVLIKLLERDGHEVHVVDNGEKAVEALTKNDYDLVLMDINMPVMNGLDATKLHRFASLGRGRTPIYALTADVTAETRAACADAGMDGCLHKPIEQRELQTVLMAIAGRRSMAPGLVQMQEIETGVVPVSRPEDQQLDLEQVPLADPTTLANLHQLGGTDFIADLVAQFTSDALGQIDALGRSVEQIDSSVFRDVTHSLRSSAANVGARRMFALCLEWRNTSTDDVVNSGEERIKLLIALLEQTQVAMAGWIDQRRAQDEEILRKSA
ncbi:MAG: ATP-binding protein [Bosea sp. (in: a-proteobacteria)]